MFNHRDLQIITFVLGCYADDIHEGDPQDFAYSESEVLALFEKAKNLWLTKPQEESR
jgi:hypothetical protein